jgi:hypothetical protein
VALSGRTLIFRLRFPGHVVHDHLLVSFPDDDPLGRPEDGAAELLPAPFLALLLKLFFLHFMTLEFSLKT